LTPFDGPHARAPGLVAIARDGIGDNLRLPERECARTPMHEQKVRLRVGAPRDEVLVEVFDGRHSRRQNDGQHRITLDGYGWRWFRVGAPDNVLDRSDLSGLRHDPPSARDPGKP